MLCGIQSFMILFQTFLCAFRFVVSCILRQKILSECGFLRLFCNKRLFYVSCYKHSSIFFLYKHFSIFFATSFPSYLLQSFLHLSILSKLRSILQFLLTNYILPKGNKETINIDLYSYTCKESSNVHDDTYV